MLFRLYHHARYLHHRIWSKFGGWSKSLPRKQLKISTWNVASAEWNTYRKFGKQPNKAFFFTHDPPLPGFFFCPKIFFSTLRLPFKPNLNSNLIFGFDAPSQIVYLTGNVFTQFLCIKYLGLYFDHGMLITDVTLVVTLRKFASLIFPILLYS